MLEALPEVLDCDKLDTYPNITFQMGGANFSLSP